ncbi:MAG: hypothetical protein A3D92_15450 [Bacteroidetes bacterium RIFCSPHIGHO2_02_FULL_44_7]|nr:MAG: hypothetical protein A3D92_15450 [Bacteroidetes bacterium RIFCSPHIGHO2_02_FULL_44_7]
MILKKLAAFFFALAFLMAIVLFTNVGRAYIPLYIARIIFMSSGAIALLLNLISFQSGKSTPLFNFLYWIGSILVFVGLVFFIMHWPYGFYILIAGLFVTGLSFLLPENLVSKAEDNEDLLDKPL